MSRVFVIAEAGVNHNGSPETAAALVDAAAQAGADAVKFQTFDPDALATAAASKAAYQRRNTGEAGGQIEMLRGLALPTEAFATLKEQAEARGLVFLSTAFDEASLDFLADALGVDPLKIASGEVTNAPFLRAHARKSGRLLLSTGMATLGEIEFALGVIAHAAVSDQPPASRAEVLDALTDPAGRRALHDRVTLLHCTTDYPAADADLNLRSITTLREAFGLPVGYSDHSAGIAAAIAAAALGASVIEKHFTLDCTLPGPDHAASLEPEALAAMVAGIRTAEAALGTPGKPIGAAERANRRAARRAVVAARAIGRGERFDESNLAVKRPGEGLEPFEYWTLLGHTADRDYEAGAPIRRPES